MNEARDKNVLIHIDQYCDQIADRRTGRSAFK